MQGESTQMCETLTSSTSGSLYHYTVYIQLSAAPLPVWHMSNRVQGRAFRWRRTVGTRARPGNQDISRYSIRSEPYDTRDMGLVSPLLLTSLWSTTLPD